MSGKKIQGLRTILSLRQNFLKKNLQKKKKKKLCVRGRENYGFSFFSSTNRDPMLHTIL